MIYTRWGSEVELLAYCGKHERKGYPAPLMLVQVRYKDDDSMGYQFCHTLRAEGGLAEIEAVVGTLPEQELASKELKAALKAAE